MTDETKTTEPRRRWYQFSLRTLLIVVTLSAVPLGWFAWKVEQGRRQRAAIAWVDKMGGDSISGGIEGESWWKEWEHKWFSRSVRWVILDNAIVSDLSPLTELKNLETLWLRGAQVSDLTPLAELKSLRFLDLSGAQVRDLSPLWELKSLEELVLYDTQVGDEQMQELQQALPNCRIIR